MKLALCLVLTFQIVLAQKTHLDTQTSGTNFYWDNTNKRILVGFNGTFTGANGKKMEIKDPGPNWTDENTFTHDTLRVTIGGYEIEREFAMNTTKHPQAIVGAIKIPASANTGLHGTGVSGYAATASTTLGAVGVFAAAHALASSTNTFGMNLLVTNCPQMYCLAADVSNNTNHWGLEIDMNTHDYQGAAPYANVRGLNVIGDSASQPLGLANAIDLDKLGLNNNIRWKNGIMFNVGTADVGINFANSSVGQTAIKIGTLSTTGASSGQEIEIHSRSSIGTDNTIRHLLDPDGNQVWLLSNSVGLYQFSNGTGVIMQIGPYVKTLVRTHIHTPGTPAVDAEISNSSCTISNNLNSLVFRCKDAVGSLFTKTL